MANGMKVVPIRSARLMKQQQQEIVQLAFENWLARFGESDGSPEDDFYLAHREVMARSRVAARLALRGEIRFMSSDH